MLARAGYHVDLFLFHVDEVMQSYLLQGATGVAVHDFSSPSKPKTGSSDTLADESPYRLASNLLKDLEENILRVTRRHFDRGLTFLRFITRSDKGLIPARVCRRTLKILRNTKYKAFIGIEKGGLVWAGMMAARLARPLIYSNLELYTRDHWFYSGCYTQRRLKLGEEQYHRKCWATIVPDEARGKVLLTDNRVPRNDMRMLYVPISRIGPTQTKREGWLQARLGLPSDQTIILYHGLIAKMRFSSELATIAQAFPTSWTLVFHGYGEDSELEEIRQANIRRKVALSLDLVDVAEESMVVSSATVSLVFYGNKYLNDALTGFSSEKLALSLQCGVPVVAFDYPSYGHIRAENCGILVRQLSEMPEAIAKILADYSGYRSRAFATFDKHYRFEFNFKKVVNAMGELP